MVSSKIEMTLNTQLFGAVFTPPKSNPTGAACLYCAFKLSTLKLDQGVRGQPSLFVHS
jgi:hypothetical protein